MIHRNAFCWCGSGKKWKKCHYPKKPPIDSSLKQTYWSKYQIHLKTPQEIDKIRKANAFASYVIDQVALMAQEGVTTLEMDTYAQKLAKEHGAKCASLGYGSPPFPNALCISINEVVCHGIPSDRQLQAGDILNIDFGCIVDGYFGDCSKMVGIAPVSTQDQALMDCTYRALMESIAILKPDVPLHAIGDTIERVAAEYNFSVVNQFVGHGVGIAYHENPQVAHHKNHSQILLVPGMVFTIEPMINVGVKQASIDPQDQWTARTLDLKNSAQFEHTLAITDTGHEILTNWTPSHIAR